MTPDQPAVWRDILDAPQDGTIVDLWVVDDFADAAFRYTDCWWLDGRWVYNSDEVGPTGINPCGMYRVTHFMFPPDPPEDTRGKALSELAELDADLLDAPPPGEGDGGRGG